MTSGNQEHGPRELFPELPPVLCTAYGQSVADLLRNLQLDIQSLHLWQTDPGSEPWSNPLRTIGRMQEELGQLAGQVLNVMTAAITD